MKEGKYWFVDFCSLEEYHFTKDPNPAWDYTAQYESGEEVSLEHSASTCDKPDAKWLYIGLLSEDKNLYEFNFPLR